MALSKKVVCLFLTQGIQAIVFGILLMVFHAKLVKYQLSTDLVLKQGSEATKLWSKRPDFPVHYHVRFYDYGPDFQSQNMTDAYKFAFWRQKDNITFNGVDQVVYTEIKTYDLVESGNLSLSDKITTHDPTNDALLETTVGEIMQSFFPNNTESRFVVKSGYADVDKTGFLINVNGTPLYEDKFYGYNIGPNVKQSVVQRIFDADFCLTNAFHFTASHSINGTSVFRFMHESKDVPDVEGCSRSMPYEVVEMGKDLLHMPSYFDVEPYTGWILRSAFRRQVNSKPDAASGKGKSLAILTYEEVAEADENTSQQLDDLVSYKVRLIHSVAGYFVLAGVVMLLILVMAHLRSRRAQAEVTTPVDLAPESLFKL